MFGGNNSLERQNETVGVDSWRGEHSSCRGSRQGVAADDGQEEGEERRRQGQVTVF